MPARLGQHFLVSKSILERIAAEACPAADVPVIEIGPGKGALTEQLLERACKITAIEVDPVLVAYLRQRFRDEPKLDMIAGDVLRVNLEEFAGSRVAVAGNLPYYITSPIIEKVLRLRARLASAVFLIQREVADRIVAQPGSRDYGFLSVQTQLLAEPKLLFTVPRGAFRPPPKVESAVIRLYPRAEIPTPDPDSFLRFASACFRQKRKTLRNNLARDFPAIEAMPEAKLRAEQLPVRQLADLHQRILRIPQ